MLKGGGHMPGAVNIHGAHAVSNNDNDDTFKSADNLEKLYN
jgi:3-mercaptopyruvate sulfurtransferase SseA